jgi:hypothetical protein
LDLLIQHKTSKEISRLLGISPHTVDQRILLARGKLGVATRNEVAQAYRRLKTIYEQPVYDFSHIDGDGEEAHDPVREVTMPAGEAVQTVATVKPRGARPRRCRQGFRRRARQWPSSPEGAWRHGLSCPPGDVRRAIRTLLRLGAIVAIALFLILIVLGG